MSDADPVAGSDAGPVADIRYPTPLHRGVLAAIVADTRADPNVRGLLLAGSLARGTARADSDLDVLAVVAVEASGETTDAAWRTAARPLPVDFLVRTDGEWRARFAPDRPGDESWGYAFLDGVILHDPEGIVGRLIAEAAGLHARYRVPAPVKAHYARLWDHVRPKMAAVLGRGDPVETGWASAVMTNDLLRTVWAANDRPNPSLDLGTVQRHLDDLTIPAGVAAGLRAILTAAPEESLRRQLTLLNRVLPYL
jgi:predicted nucleotidyltransferase